MGKCHLRIRILILLITFNLPVTAVTSLITFFRETFPSAVRQNIKNSDNDTRQESCDVGPNESPYILLNNLCSP